MNKNIRFFSGVSIVYSMLIIYALMILLIIDINDITESTKSFLRATGRLAMFLFFFSFGASALNKIFNASWTKYLIRNRRYIGISTVILLWVHMLAIINLAMKDSHWFAISAPWYIIYPGGVVFLLAGVMGLTSNNFSQKKLGIKRWRKLHLIIGYIVLLTFIDEYMLIHFLQPYILPNYEFGASNSPVLMTALSTVPFILIFIRVWANKKKI